MSENKLNYEISMSFLTSPFDELLLEVKLESLGNETLFGENFLRNLIN